MTYLSNRTSVTVIHVFYKTLINKNMARRMFSPNIVGSDAFLEMPTSSRELYFQLGMSADDDGFVNPRRIIRMIGASEDDLKILVAKRFVIPFENGVVVIKHWRINNLVRKDWYKPTQYIEQRQTLFLKENGSYTEDSSKGKPFVNEFVHVGKVRLGKKNKNTVTAAPCLLANKKNAMRPNKMGAYNESLSSDSFEEMIDIDSRETVRDVPKTSDGKIMRDLIDWAETRRGSKFVNRAKQLKALSNLKLAKKSPSEIRNRWIELEQDDFYRKTGFDFMSIANSFDRK
jgi:hypothetical protein